MTGPGAPAGAGAMARRPSATSSSTRDEKSRTFGASASARLAQSSCPCERSVAATSCFSATVQVGQAETIQRACACSSAATLSIAFFAAASKAPA